MTTDAFAALRRRDFVLMISGGGLLLTVAILVQEVALGIALYELTGDPLMLGLIGLAEAVPYMAVALFGGTLADRLPRKWLIVGAISAMLIGSLALDLVIRYSAALSRTELLLCVYAAVAWVGLARGFFGPAAAALRGALIPIELQANASAWSTTFWQTGMIAGPVLGGLLYSKIGLADTLSVVVTLMALCLLLLSLVRAPVQLKPVEKEPIFIAMREGFRFVFSNRLLLYSLSLDLVAVLFGGVMAMLPAVAHDLLGLGPEWVGWLRAAPATGAVLMLLVLARYSPVRHVWRNMLLAVTGFGLATLVFALSNNFWLSCAMLFMTGVFDSVSVVIRQYLLQVIPPDHLRGRVLSVNGIFVTCSNEIGAFVSGASARVLGLAPAMLAGAGLTLASAVWMWRKGRDLLSLRMK
jgi:MFS family permease